MLKAVVAANSNPTFPLNLQSFSTVAAWIA